MGIIRVLPEHIANKIAAGEVIERPASIIKELIENSMDAGATSIDVVIETGGKNFIRISDNGCGMDRADAELACERHATSKVKTEEDLASIRSFGFRGEALPSIAAVSRMRLVTRSQTDSVGTELVIEGGVRRALQDHPTRVGTIIEVRDLFFNTPARRKFLKSDSTEAGHAMDGVSHMALCARGIHISFQQDGRKIFECPPSDDLTTRASLIFGKESSRDLLELDKKQDGISLQGLIGLPVLHRANRKEIHLFVNRRWIRSLPLSYAVQAGYHGLLMHGRYPVAILFIDVDGALVDVNVHPSKQEVRFSNEGLLTSLIKKAIEERLSVADNLAPQFKMAYSFPPPSQMTVLDRPLNLQQMGSYPIKSAPVLDEPIVIKDRLRITKILGQIHNTFICAQTEEGFLILDQHAAHERVMFETLLKNCEGMPAESQALLLEETIELHPRSLQIFQEALPVLTRIGFEIEEFGEKTFVIRSVPALFGDENPVKLLTTFVEELEEGTGRTVLEDHREMMAALCACTKQSVKAGDPLAPAAIRSLLQRLARCENPFTCPHGRPVFFTHTFAELEKQFKRV